MDGYLQLKNLKEARKFAVKVLNEEDAELMLTEAEIEYLKLVSALESLEIFMKKRKKPE